MTMDFLIWAHLQNTVFLYIKNRALSAKYMESVMFVCVYGGIEKICIDFKYITVCIYNNNNLCKLREHYLLKLIDFTFTKVWAGIDLTIMSS